MLFMETTCANCGCETGITQDFGPGFCPHPSGRRVCPWGRQHRVCAKRRGNQEADMPSGPGMFVKDEKLEESDPASVPKVEREGTPQ